MDNMINRRTPEEIKNGLECCNTFNVCHKCPYEKAVDTEHGWGCVVIRNADTLAYIQQLERERDEARNDLDTINYANTELHSAYEAMKRERDAAVDDMKHMHLACETCIHYTPGYFCPGCRSRSNWQWRGVQEGEQ